MLGQRYFKAKPKLHMFLEMCFTANTAPSSTWTYRDDSWGGGVSKEKKHLLTKEAQDLLTTGGARSPCKKEIQGLLTKEMFEVKDWTSFCLREMNFMFAYSFLASRGHNSTPLGGRRYK